MPETIPADTTLEAFQFRANALLELKRFNEALAAYDETSELDPSSLDALNKRGIALLELKRYQDSLANYDKALALDPGRLDVLHNRGNALAELSRFVGLPILLGRKAYARPVRSAAFVRAAEAGCGTPSRSHQLRD